MHPSFKEVGSQAERILSYSGEGPSFCSTQAFNCLDEAHSQQGMQYALLIP